MITTEPRSPSDVVLNPFNQSPPGSFSHGTAVTSFSSRHSRYTPDQGNSRRRSTHQPIRISVVGSHVHEAQHHQPSIREEVETSKRPRTRSFSSYLHAQSRRSILIVACAMVSLCLLCFHSLHSSDSFTSSHASHLQSKQYNVKFVTPLKTSSFKQQQNSKPMFTEIDAAKLWKAPALSVKPSQPLSTAARSEIQAQLNDLHAAAAAEQPIIDHTVNITQVNTTTSAIINSTLVSIDLPVDNVTAAQPVNAVVTASKVLPVLEDDSPPAEEALFDTPAQTAVTTTQLPVSDAAITPNNSASLTKRITADDEENVDVADDLDMDDDVVTQPTATTPAAQSQQQYPVLTTYQRELQMQQLKKSDLGARIVWETPSNTTAAAKPLFSSDILFVIPTTSQHHAVVRESLLTWGQHLMPHLRVYSDRAPLPTEAAFPVNMTVVENPYATMTLASDKHRHAWRVHSIVADLQREIAHSNTYKFVVFLPDLAFPLLDQISWRLSEYQRIEYNGDSQPAYPLFLSGKIATKQYDPSLLLFKEQAATADKALQGVKLTFSSPAVTGINLQMLSQLAGATSSCPVLATDELTLSALMHCAGVGSNDVLDGYNFFPSTRHNHREKGVVMSTAVADWRGVDLLQAYKNAKTVREAYEYYYGKLHSTQSAAVVVETPVSARDAVLAAASAAQLNEPSHSSSDQMAIEAKTLTTHSQ